ncbi:MAG TPA: hypothetical protein VF590_25970, partial [Isosphaeraceae bacterium]
MRWQVTGLILLQIGTISSPATRGSGDEEAIRRRFLEEYPAASQRLRAFYTNLRMSGRVVDKNFTTGVEEIREWEFGGNAESLRGIEVYR